MTFLSRDEVRELTGYIRPADQIRWLRRQGLLFWINARGRPVVPRDAVAAQPARQTFELGVVP